MLLFVHPVKTSLLQAGFFYGRRLVTIGIVQMLIVWCGNPLIHKLAKILPRKTLALHFAGLFNL